MKKKVVLITGASSGIGKSTAEAFAAKGANVVVAARRENELHNLVKQMFPTVKRLNKWLHIPWRHLVVLIMP